MEASGSQAARDSEGGRAARKELGRGCWDAPRKPARTGKRNGVFARRRLSSFLSARRLMQVRRDPTVCGSAMRAPRPCRVRRCRVPNEGQAALQSSRAPHAASPRRIRRDLINSNERLIGARFYRAHTPNKVLFRTLLHNERYPNLLLKDSLPLRGGAQPCTTFLSLHLVLSLQV